MPSAFHKMLDAVKGPKTQLFVGVLIAITGAIDVVKPFLDEVRGNEMDMGAHHGVTLYGIYMFLGALGEVVKGTRDLREGVKIARGEGARAEEPALRATPD